MKRNKKTCLSDALRNLHRVAISGLSEGEILILLKNARWGNPHCFYTVECPRCQITQDGKPYQMLSIISSFVEDKIYLRCPTKIMEHHTQPEYITLYEQAYPTKMEQMLLEEQREKLFRRKPKSE